MDRNQRYLAQVLVLLPFFVAIPVSYDLFFKQEKELRQMVEALDAQATDVLLFGDSSIGAIGRCDEGSSGIQRWIEELGSFSLLTVDENAYSPIIYQDLVEVVAGRAHQPRLILFPINLRSFSDAWFTNPSYQFELDRVRATARYVSFEKVDLLAFIRLRYSNESAEQERAWGTRNVIRGDIDLGPRDLLTKRSRIPGVDAIECRVEGDEQFAQQLALKFSYHYMNPITPSHGMFDAIERTMEKARDNGIELLVYVTPINFHDGVRFVGEEFRERVEGNLQVIRSVFDAVGIDYLDLSTTLPRERFVDRRFACEHLDDRGRRFVAETVTARIEEILSGANEVQAGP